jgi:large subunit ribosomal protein L23
MSTVENEARLADIILAPHVSEKTTRLAESHRQIGFRVRANASKSEIRRAVEVLFEVEVAGVRTLNQSGKRRGMGRIRGRQSNWKKAYVTLKPGFDIDFAGAD